jgi:hypothetical protein
MLCEKFESCLHEVLDQRERPELDPRLREHALTCDDCAEKLAAQARLFDGLRTAPAPAPSRNFTDRVLAAAKSRRKATAWGKIVGSLVAIAAVVLVAVVPVWWLLNARLGGGSGGIRPGDRPSVAQDRLAAAPETREAPDPAIAVGSDIAEVPSARDRQPRVDTPRDVDPMPDAPDESAVVVDSTPSTEDESRDGLFGESIMSWEIAANIPGVDKQRAEMLQSVWTERVATPLKPVTSSVTGAVNVLRRTLAVEPALQRDTDDPKPQAGIKNGVRIKDLA